MSNFPRSIEQNGSLGDGLRKSNAAVPGDDHAVCFPWPAARVEWLFVPLRRWRSSWDRFFPISEILGQCSGLRVEKKSQSGGGALMSGNRIGGQ